MLSDTEKYIREIRRKLKTTTDKHEIQLLREQLFQLKELIKRDRLVAS